MLGLAKRLDATILTASTSEVYGNPEVHPQTESYKGHVNTTGIKVVMMKVKELPKLSAPTIKEFMA